MIWIDYLIIGVILVSAFISLLRGFVREALSLAGWILAFWVAIRFSGRFAGLLENSISDSTFRLITGFVILFLLTLVATMVVNFFAAQVIRRTGLTRLDRAIGMMFGFLRGVVLVAVLVLLAGLTPLPSQPWWKQSLMLGQFQGIAVWLRDLLPADVGRNFRY